MVPYIALVVFLSLLRRPASSPHGDQLCSTAVMFAYVASMSEASRDDDDESKREELRVNDDFATSSQSQVVHEMVHVYRYRGRRCYDKTRLFSVQGEQATEIGCSQKCLDLGNCEVMTLYLKSSDAKQNMCIGCLKNGAGPMPGWLYYEKQVRESTELASKGSGPETVAQRAVMVHVYQTSGKRCKEAASSTPGYFKIKGETAIFKNCADQCLQNPACARVTLWEATRGKAYNECRGCAANEVEDKIGWKYYEKQQTVEAAREHLQVEAAREHLQVEVLPQEKQALVDFGRKHLKQQGGEERKAAAALMEKMDKIKYEVTPIGTLAESGANDAVRAFWFEPQKAPATQRTARPSDSSAALQLVATPEEVLFKGAAVYKKTSKARFSEARTQSEVVCTRRMSESCGLSIGFAGSFEDAEFVHMLTDYRPSRNFYTGYKYKLLSRYTGGTEDQTKMQLFVLGQLIFILKQLKEQQIVHRDFKGENLILREECWGLFETDLAAAELIKNLVRRGCAITLIDYGLACSMEPEGKSSPLRCATNKSVMGTRGYRSQAVMRLGLYDYKSDLFGMGATAVDIFTLSKWPPGEQRKDAEVQLPQVKKLLEDAEVAEQVADIIMQMVTEPVKEIKMVDTLWSKIPQNVQHGIEDLSQGLLAERRGRIYLH